MSRAATLPAPWPPPGLPPWITALGRRLRQPMELRIDVQPAREDIEAELQRLHGRLHAPGDPLHGLPEVPTGRPGIVLRWREADGEFYVYVEDQARRRLAGCTVFNRLIELDRHADALLRAPHSRYHPDYQRQGLASAVYRWALDAGLCLLSGARQSEGAHALWGALARHYPRGFVELRRKRLRWLGTRVDDATRDALDTRMLMLGHGWPLDRFAERSRMAMPLSARIDPHDGRDD